MSKRSLLRWLVVVAVLPCAPRQAYPSENAVSAAPESVESGITDDEAARIAMSFVALLSGGDIDGAMRLQRDTASRLESAYGPTDPQTLSCKSILVACETLKTLDASQFELFRQGYRDFQYGVTLVWEIRAKAILDVKDVALTRRLFLNGLTQMEAIVPKDTLFVIQCDWWQARCYALTRDFGQANELAKQILTRCGQILHPNDPTMVALKLTYAGFLLEQNDRPVDPRVPLAEVVAFTERYGTEVRFRYWREMATTLLAESASRNDLPAEADRLYSQVRSHLPKVADYGGTGWCKSWCDMHDARRLMEQDRSADALKKIDDAIAGTRRFGGLNPNMGLTMERLLRMRLEICRKLGWNWEAQHIEERIQAITDNVAELQAALAQHPASTAPGIVPSQGPSE